MFDLIKILIVFILIIRLLQLKWNLGGVMLIGAAALGLLMGMGPFDILKTAFHAGMFHTSGPASSSRIVSFGFAST